MELTVLGKSPALPDDGGANSGYLVREEGFTLLVDCGSGVFAKLRALADPGAVDAVLITHMHADHTVDVIAFSHALTYHYRDSGRQPVLWLPPGARRAFTTLGRVYGDEDLVTRAFAATHEYDPERSLSLGPLELRFTAVPHFVPTWACDIRAGDGRRITFGADCAPNDAIVALAAGTDLLMLEATEGPTRPAVAAGALERLPQRTVGHLSAQEAGELARRAGAHRLLLTHYSDLLDSAALGRAAAAAFGGPVELAREGARHTV